mgnify:CR=1 FL=1
MAGANQYRQNNRKQDNYFTRSIQKKGLNFMSLKSSSEFEVDAIRVFRDLARGNINIDEYGEYFLNEIFLDSCIKTAYSNLTKNELSFKGMQLLYKESYEKFNYVDVNIPTLMEYYRKMSEIYRIIYSYLNLVKETKETIYLVVLSDALYEYRFII